MFLIFYNRVMAWLIVLIAKHIENVLKQLSFGYFLLFFIFFSVMDMITMINHENGFVCPLINHFMKSLVYCDPLTQFLGTFETVIDYIIPRQAAQNDWFVCKTFETHPIIIFTVNNHVQVFSSQLELYQVLQYQFVVLPHCSRNFNPFFTIIVCEATSEIRCKIGVFLTG